MSTPSTSPARPQHLRVIGAAVTAYAAALALLAALAASTSPTAGATTASSTPKCATSRLVVWLDTRGNGAAGSVYYNLKFTNLSGRACTLLGYAGVSAINLGGRQLGSAASRNNHTPTRLVRLASGGTVNAVLQITDARNFPSATCRPVTAAGLRVYPPNQTTSKVIPFPLGACSRAGPVYLHVEATG
jgi:hypothetical protein